MNLSQCANRKIMMAPTPLLIQPHSHLVKGVAVALLGYLCVALMTVFGKLLAGVPTSILVFFQFSIGLLFSLPGGLKGGASGLKTAHPQLMLLRALTGLLNVSAFFFALRFIPLIDAVALQNTAPLFVPLILLFWFKKTISHRLWAALTIGFIGAMLIVKPSLHTLNIGTLSGLAAGFLTAASMVVNAALKKRNEPTGRISFYLMAISTLSTLPIVLTQLDIITALTWHQWLFLFLLGFFTYACQSLITHAFGSGSTQMVASLSYSGIAFSGLLGWAIWGHIPDGLALIGVVAVTVGGTLGIFWEKMEKDKAPASHNLPKR